MPIKRGRTTKQSHHRGRKPGSKNRKKVEEQSLNQESQEQGGTGGDMGNDRW